MVLRCGRRGLEPRLPNEGSSPLNVLPFVIFCFGSKFRGSIRLYGGDRGDDLPIHPVRLIEATGCATHDSRGQTVSRCTGS